MTTLDPSQFAAYFRELHGLAPYPWQQRMADAACDGTWPGAIDLPTGSGKTACIDIAIFALACQAGLPVTERNAPRRIFFCVNRRVIVDEAYLRARHIAKLLWEAEQGRHSDKPVLEQTAQALRHIAGTNREDSIPPLDALELRGGIYRDNRWARSMTQPTVVCTTIDQLGSRLLFRGYGVSSNTAPIQAALIAHDSMVLLDEAHICEPFRQTLESARGYLDPKRWAQADLGVRPMTLVPMTATPNEAMRRLGVVRLGNDDRQHPSLRRRLSASKPARLQASRKLVDDAVSQAVALASERPSAIGIIVNRIATARQIHHQLCELQNKTGARRRKLPEDPVIELVIGSMRPIDRDAQTERLRGIIGPDRPPVSTRTSFVVSTQCIEVGADYDFDGLVTECASLDALRQRFGRLNRGGRPAEDGSPINAHAALLIDRRAITPERAICAKEATKDPTKRLLDPIYGNALARTWNWLAARAENERIDFGIDGFQQLLAAETEEEPLQRNLLAPAARANAPVMLPAYLDLWCQTAPRPAPDPDVSLFIHGPQRNQPDVQVCWRADLVDDEHESRSNWAEIVALLPPTSAECINVPMGRLRRWLTSDQKAPDNDADVLDVPAPATDEHQATRARHSGILWRGAERSKLLTSTRQLQPGDTLVLPASALDSDTLGHLTVDRDDNGQRVRIIDVAENASEQARDKAILRLHPSLRPTLPADAAFDALLQAAALGEQTPAQAEWPSLLDAAAHACRGSHPKLASRLEVLAGTRALRVDPYPDQAGVVLSSVHRLGSSSAWFIRAMDEGDDESSRIQGHKPVSLDDHSVHVRDCAAASLTRLPLSAFDKAATRAAFLHDWGKADVRFQAMLRRADRTDTYLYAGAGVTPLAKSSGVPATKAQRAIARQRSGLPRGFRHEMLSVQLAEQSGQLPDEPRQRDLILHLIAAHHGYARPFAPVAPDDELPDTAYADATLSHEQRARQLPPERLDSGIAQRFWLLTRRHGWWGVAYLEAVLRLADQQASAAEQAGQYDHDTNEPTPDETAA